MIKEMKEASHVQEECESNPGCCKRIREEFPVRIFFLSSQSHISYFWEFVAAIWRLDGLRN